MTWGMPWGWPWGGVDPAVLLPNGTDAFVGLFTELPDIAGLGGVESTADRVAHSRWTNVGEQRTNVGTVDVTITQREKILGWGLWDASTAGTLLAWGEFRMPTAQQPQQFDVAEGDRVQVEHLGLRVGPLGSWALGNAWNEDFIEPANALLPYGAAWNRTPSSVTQKLLTALSAEFSRVQSRARQLINEMFPDSATELLGTWEEFAGLPGECDDPPTTIEGRRTALTAKLRSNVTPTPAFFQELAESLGYTGVVVQNEADPFLCTSDCTEDLRGGPWYFTWSITVSASSANDGTLQCLVRSFTPQHTTVIFNIP